MEERYKEIEKSIIKKYRKDIWSKFVKAVKEYELIEENDKIMVCISGGKDSFLLAKCIEEIKKHGKFNFDACYVVMDRLLKRCEKRALTMTGSICHLSVI